MPKNYMVHSVVSSEKRDYNIESSVFDLIYSTKDNSGVFPTIGYYENLLDQVIDFKDFHLCYVSNQTDCYLFINNKLCLFLLFSTGECYDYRCYGLKQIYCTDVFHSVRDFDSIQVGSSMLDVEQIDKSLKYKKNDYHSDCFTSEHICREGVLKIDWEANDNNELVVKEILFTSDCQIAELELHAESIINDW